MNQQEEAFYIWEKNQHLSPEECWERAGLKIATNNRRKIIHQMKQERMEQRKEYFKLENPTDRSFLHDVTTWLQKIKLILWKN